jgi:hypothetical protein
MKGRSHRTSTERRLFLEYLWQIPLRTGIRDRVSENDGSLISATHKRANKPMQMWIWRDGASEPIVTAKLFERARTIIESRHRHLSDQELLDLLRHLPQVQGRLSGLLNAARSLTGIKDVFLSCPSPGSGRMSSPCACGAFEIRPVTIRPSNIKRPSPRAAPTYYLRSCYPRRYPLMK